MRMVLALFMARYLSFADIGVFSLLIGLTGLLPGAAGLGLSYFVNRTIIGMPGERAIPFARDRLLITAVCGMVSALGLGAAAAFGQVVLPVNPWLCGMLIVIEMVGFDLHLLLIARHRAMAANLLLFVRSAFWIPIYMAVAYLFSPLRTIEALVITWLCGLIIYGAATLLFFRSAFTSRSFWKTPFDFGWLRMIAPRAMSIWLSDFALAVGQNIDRFIISSFLGIAAAGVYYFYFSIANAAFLVAQSATTQPYMPKLRIMFSGDQAVEFVSAVNRCLKKLVLFSLATFSLAEVGTIVLVKFLNRSELESQYYVMPIILLGMMSKTVNEYLGIVDYIMEKDFRFIIMNIFLFLTVISVTIGLTMIYGLIGAALGVVLTMTLFAVARGTIWFREAKQLPFLHGGTSPFAS